MAGILIVDDDEGLLQLMGEYLESTALEHDLAVGAQQARNLLKCFKYEMVISDFKMPGESGLDLLRYVSRKYPETPFVLMTGYPDLRIKRESIRMGARAYIQKPFYVNELMQTIINLTRLDEAVGPPAGLATACGGGLEALDGSIINRRATPRLPCQNENLPAKAGKRNDQIKPAFRIGNCQCPHPEFPDGDQVKKKPVRHWTRLTG
jgi:DNA-binding response OmpR family regulator